MADNSINEKRENGTTPSERNVVDDFTGKEELIAQDVVAPGGDAYTRHIVEKVEFPVLKDDSTTKPFGIDVFRGVKMNISGELGRTDVRVKDLISLKEGSMLKLDSLADENITLLINEAPFAQGEVVVINDRYGVRVTSFVAGDADEE